MVWCGTSQLRFAVKHASLLFDESLFSQTYIVVQKCRLRRLISENTENSIKCDLTCLQKDEEDIPQGCVVHENVV